MHTIVYIPAHTLPRYTRLTYLVYYAEGKDLYVTDFTITIGITAFEPNLYDLAGTNRHVNPFSVIGVVNPIARQCSS